MAVILVRLNVLNGDAYESISPNGIIYELAG